MIFFHKDRILLKVNPYSYLLNLGYQTPRRKS